MSENNCTNCANGKKQGGLILCSRENRLKTTPSQGCKYHVIKKVQVTLEEIE